MELTVVKTKSIEMEIDGAGVAVQIKQSSVTIGENKKIQRATGSLYDLSGEKYLGTYSYSLDGMMGNQPSKSVNIQGTTSLEAASKDVDSYLSAVEAEQVNNLSL